MQVGKIEQLTISPFAPITMRLSDLVVEGDTFNFLRAQVEKWAEEKGIFQKATPLSQHKKTQEEVDELKEALETNNKEEIVDAIGDILVTLIIQAKMNDIDPVFCLQSAYDVIKGRTGQMIDGIFVKDK